MPNTPDTGASDQKDRTPTECGASTSDDKQRDGSGQGNTLNGTQQSQESQPIQLSTVLQPGTRSDNLGLNNFANPSER